MRNLFALVFLISCFYACKIDKTIDDRVKDINLVLNVERFDSIFSQANPNDLPKLKQQYPFLFSRSIPDSLWSLKMKDTLVQQLYAETLLAFKNFDYTKDDIALLFKHLKYFFPEFKTPRVITVVSEVDYRNKAIVTDSIVLIALDTYLGDNHEFYQGIPQYISQNMLKEQITSDLAGEYAKKYIYQNQKRTLLDEMIYSGKILYFKDKVLPLKSDAEKIGYTKAQMDWAKANEEQIWRYFIEKEVLYSTDSDLPSRFINPAPFSKFYLELDSESPGRLGQFIGWQIVRAYMDNNNVDFQKMLITNSNDIFKNSKFKPQK